MDTKKLQAKEYELLVKIKELFDKNGIDFWLAYGTALGCVRHDGFIPWDDDVDIFIRGEDYPKVKKIFAEQDTDFLLLHDYETKENYPYVFPKIVDKHSKLKESEYDHLDYECGVYVDLFLLFEVNNNRLVRWFEEKIRYFRYALVRGHYKNATKVGGIKRFIVKMLNKHVNCNKVQRNLYKRYTKAFKNNKTYLIEPNVFKNKDLIKSCYFNAVEFGVFEQSRMPLPMNVEEYLTDTYGDYMRLPKEEDRVSVHNFSECYFD